LAAAAASVGVFGGSAAAALMAASLEFTAVLVEVGQGEGWWGSQRRQQ